MMNWIAAQPLRKPIAVFSVIFTMVVIVWVMRGNTDIPSGVVTVLVALNGVTVGGYFGSSAYESVRSMHEPNFHREDRKAFPPPPDMEGDVHE